MPVIWDILSAWGVGHWPMQTGMWGWDVPAKNAGPDAPRARVMMVWNGRELSIWQVGVAPVHTNDPVWMLQVNGDELTAWASEGVVHPASGHALPPEAQAALNRWEDCIQGVPTFDSLPTLDATPERL